MNSEGDIHQAIFSVVEYAKPTQHGCVGCRGGGFIVVDAGVRRCRNGL